MARIPAEELTDRFVVATEEQDVLYVLYWLDEMKRMNCLEQAINNKREFIHTPSRLYEALLTLMNNS